MEQHGKQGPSDATAGFCDLNLICESAARIGNELAELPCDERSPAVKEGIVEMLADAPDGICPQCGMKLRRADGIRDAAHCTKCGHIYTTACGGAPRWVFSEWGMAHFVGRALAHGWAQPAGEVYHLGEVCQRDLYFAVNPPPRFFSSHNKAEFALVIGSSRAEVPGEWKGEAAYFNELFYYHKNELRVAPNIQRRLLPRERAGLRRGKNRLIHERRDGWLRFIVSLLAKPYNPRDFFRGVIRRGVVCKWFVHNIPGAPNDPKTYKRDYDRFKTYCPPKDRHDFRESAIILLLRQAADPQFTRRVETAEEVTQLLLQLKQGEQKYGHPIEISSKWQYTGDSRGTRTLVAVAPDESPIDEMEF